MRRKNLVHLIAATCCLVMATACGSGDDPAANGSNDTAPQAAGKTGAPQAGTETGAPDAAGETGAPDASGETGAPDASGETEAPEAGDDSETDRPEGVSGPCDLTEPAVVARIFAADYPAEAPGDAQNCRYTMTGGKDLMRSPKAQKVDVFYYGGVAYDEQRAQARQVHGGQLTDVRGVGDKAFRPRRDDDYIVVQAGDTVFGVGVTSPLLTDFNRQVENLARQIAADAR